MVPLTFAPDADPTAPGVMVDVTNLIPSERGYQDAPLAKDVLSTATPLPSTVTVVNAATIRAGVGGAKSFVGTTSGLYQVAAAGWTQLVSVVTAGETYWSFTNLGSVFLATTYALPMYASSGGAFAAVAGAPYASAALVTTNTLQVMALGTNADGDEWKCSALADHTSWTPSAATQAASGRLLATPGYIVGAVGFGPNILVFKNRSMYWMRYVNVPVIWATEVLANDVGLIAKGAVVDVGERVLFMAEDDIYSFDGTHPVSIGGPVRRWFFNRLAWAGRAQIQAVFDEVTRCVWWWYPLHVDNQSDQAQPLAQALVYHVPSGRWGHANATARAPFIFTNNVVSDKPRICAINDGKLQELTARTATSTVRLGWFGDDMQATTLTKVRPRFLTTPATASAVFRSSQDLTLEKSEGSSNLQEGAFGTHQNAHWHSATMTLKAPFEVTQIGSDIPRPSGKR